MAQTAPVLRDTAGNAARIREHALAAGADLLLTPELSLTGYDVRDGVHRLAVPVVPGADCEPLRALADVSGCIVAGVIEAAAGGPYNAAVAVCGGRVVFRHRKLYLPTYGMFDEGRWFGRGTALETWRMSASWRMGVLVCEDLWHPALSYVLALQHMNVLLVQAAAPGRGVWQGGESSAFASADVWERIARTTAQLYGIYVAFANRVGVEGGVTFAGGSLVVAPDGSVIARATDTDEVVISAELRLSDVQRARRPYDHSRDDDARIVLRELARVVAAS